MEKVHGKSWTVWSDVCFLSSWQKKQIQFLPENLFDTGIMNSKIIYDKMNSTAGIPAMDFHFHNDLSCSMIGKSSNRKTAAPIHQPYKNL